MAKLPAKRAKSASKMAKPPPEMAKLPTKMAKFRAGRQHSNSRCGVTKVLAEVLGRSSCKNAWPSKRCGVAKVLAEVLVRFPGLPETPFPLRFLQVAGGPGSQAAGVGGVGGPEP